MKDNFSLLHTTMYVRHLTRIFFGKHIKVLQNSHLCLSSSSLDKMNAVLLITITVTVALVYGHNSRPCEVNYDNNAFDNFVWKHIILETFHRSSKTAWSRWVKWFHCETGHQLDGDNVILLQSWLTFVSTVSAKWKASLTDWFHVNSN